MGLLSRVVLFNPEHLGGMSIMKIRVSAGGPASPRVVVDGRVTIEGPDLEIYLEELNPGAEIQGALLGQARNGDLYLQYTCINGSTKVVRVNAAGPRVVSDVVAIR
jgi:hypothetical protein